MNKFVICFILLLCVSCSAKGILDSLSKASKALNDFSKKTEEFSKKVLDTTEKIQKITVVAVDTIQGVYDSIESLSDNVKRLGKSLQSDFNDIIGTFNQIISKTKSYAENTYSSVERLYNAIMSQINGILIPSAEHSLETFGNHASDTFKHFNSDVKILYDQGKLLVNEISDNKNMKQEVADLKKQNKENLENALQAVNNSLNSANILIAHAKLFIANCTVIYNSQKLSVQEKMAKLQSTIVEYIKTAQSKLLAFRNNQKDQLKNLLLKAQQLESLSKSIIDKINQFGKDVKENLNNGVNTIKAGTEEVRDILNEKPKNTDETSNSDSLEQIKQQTSAAMEKLTQSVSHIKDTLKGMTQSMTDEFKNFKYEVTAANLNIRSGPDTSSAVVGTLTKGESVQIYEINQDFARIGVDKWVATKYLKVVSAVSDEIQTIKDSISKRLNTLKSFFNMFK